MGFLERLAQQRLNQITSHAREYLDTDEHIVRWVRAKNPEGRGEGFIYLTETHCIIHWRGRAEAPGALALKEINSWGLNKDAHGGPVLGIEAEDRVVFVQLPVTTRAMAEHATSFVTEFAELAPYPASEFSPGGHLGEFATDGDIEVEGKPRPISAHASRIGLTVVGIVLVVLGAALSLPGVPGPGLLIVLAGLGVLAREYDWAKDALDWARAKYRSAASRLKKSRRPN